MTDIEAALLLFAAAIKSGKDVSALARKLSHRVDTSLLLDIAERSQANDNHTR